MREPCRKSIAEKIVEALVNGHAAQVLRSLRSAGWIESRQVQVGTVIGIPNLVSEELPRIEGDSKPDVEAVVERVSGCPRAARNHVFSDLPERSVRLQRFSDADRAFERLSKGKA